MALFLLLKRPFKLTFEVFLLVVVFVFVFAFCFSGVLLRESRTRFERSEV